MRRPQPAEDVGGQASNVDAQSPRSEQLVVRSHDHHWAYDVDIAIRTPDGDRVFRES